ncbi:MAG TPA: energy-coupling factor ABC transporter permease [Rhodocyclaceae bacterium]|nr:energy-coupling factor ABC transporter permease [Rhodocyclaceae bacterium]
MNLPAELFPAWWHGLAWVAVLTVLWWLARTAPWGRLVAGGHAHRLFGLAVALAVLWSMNAGVMPGLNLHLLGAMAATLALGPQFAMVALGLALAAVTLNGALEWSAWAINFLVMVVVPVCFAHRFRRIIECALPAHFFVFVFVVAFFGSGATVVVEGVTAAAMLVAAGAYPAAFLLSDYLPFFMLLGFAEAWISGAVIALLVVYKPEWVEAFDDRRYLLDK